MNLVVVARVTGSGFGLVEKADEANLWSDETHDARWPIQSAQGRPVCGHGAA